MALFVSMTLQPYTKPHATAKQRVIHLRSKGLIIPRPTVAAKKIEMIGYERLRIYFLSRRQSNIAGRPFVAGTSYKDILRIYECDAKLREACFTALCKFELMFRNAISEVLSANFGSHPYEQHSAYKDISSQINALQTFMGVYAKSKDQRARHYRENYSPPALPPIWTMKEFLTFGAASHIFKNLDGQLRTRIASQFGLPSDQTFVNWLECMVDLRNMCAHHDRLFNRSFQKQPSTYRRGNIPTAGRNKLKATLQCLDHMMESAGAKISITDKVGKMLARYPELRPAESGY